MASAELYTIGDLARRSGLSVRTVRFYADVGVVPETARSAGGYRLYDLEAAARLDLVRTLRDLGLPLDAIRDLLSTPASLAEVAAAHEAALETQIRTLRLRRGVLRAVARANTTPQEAALMHRLVAMSAYERERLIEDFLAAAFSGLDVNPELVAVLETMKPELPDDPEPGQVQAWVELVELVQDPAFRASVRRMAEYQAAERADGDRTGLHHDLTTYLTRRVEAALAAGTAPADRDAAPIVADLVAHYAATFGAADTPDYRAKVLRRVEMGNNPRTERYLELLRVINGWPAQPSLGPVLSWFCAASRAHPGR